jgi:hypothetical protein
VKQRLDDSITRIVGALNVWRLELLPQHMSPLLSDSADLETSVQRLSNRTLVDPIAARAVVLHLSTWLLLACLDIVCMTTFPWSVAYMVRSILSICKEYSYYQEGMGVIPWTTAIRIVHATRLDDHEELRSWCRDLCVRLETRYNVRLLSDIIAALPGPDEVLTFDEE